MKILPISHLGPGLHCKIDDYYREFDDQCSQCQWQIKTGVKINVSCLHSNCCSFKKQLPEWSLSLNRPQHKWILHCFLTFSFIRQWNKKRKKPETQKHKHTSHTHTWPHYSIYFSINGETKQKHAHRICSSINWENLTHPQIHTTRQHGTQTFYHFGFTASLCTSDPLNGSWLNCCIIYLLW